MFKIEYMQRALILAERGKGFVSPNPLVGCVIVKNGRIIGEGFHEKYGEAHAEINALKNCIESPQGSDLYVNLEPCSHFGKTPPCAERLVSEKIKNVYIGTKDPNPEVSGKGIEILKNAGVHVEENFLVDSCSDLNKVFFHWIKKQRSYVILKIAASLDGFIADDEGSSMWISSENSRKEVHTLRSEVDAVLIGSGTVKADNPKLNVRLVDGRNPQKIILDFSGSLSADFKVFDRNTHVVVLAENASEEYKMSFKRKKTNIIQIESINIANMLKVFAKMGFASVLVEGGAGVAGMFADSGCIDELILYKAPFLLGSGRHMFTLTDPLRMGKRMEFLGEDTRICLQGLLKKSEK